MKFVGYLIFATLCAEILSESDSVASSKQNELRSFPEGFMFGTATAAYQIEGAWNVSDKSQSIWDYTARNEPWRVVNQDNGDIACDSYHNYKRDVEMLRELGVQFYRFSIAWTRILPTGFPNYVSEDGVAYYNNLINELLKYNIKPVVTIYHWDLPQRLQDLGGWANPLIETWFKDYSRVAFDKFGDRVKDWVTINEPHQICHSGYGSTVFAPFLNMNGIAHYICAYNLVKAHAASYHLYNDEFRASQGGRVGFSTSMGFTEPLTDSPDDLLAAERVMQFSFGTYVHPVYHPDGDFPPVVKQRIAEKSKEQGYPRSRLPEFTQEEVEYIRGTADFFGINHYSSGYAYMDESAVGIYDVPSIDDDISVGHYGDPNWVIGAASWLPVVPWGFRKILVYIKDNYNNPEIMVTENGYATYGGLNDDERISYYRQYMEEMLKAILDEGANVSAYTAWSLMDNFEWLDGYVNRFGLYEVDFDDPARTRTARKSAIIYKEIVRSRVIDPDYEPESLDISIDGI